MLTYKDQVEIIKDLIEFFPEEYKYRKYNQPGSREYNYVLVHFLENKEIYFQPVGNVLDPELEKIGYITISKVVINIVCKDQINVSGYKESYIKSQQLRRHISLKWQNILTNADLKQPIKVEDLSGILTTEREYIHQLTIDLITEESYTPDDIETVYVNTFSGVLMENIIDYQEFDTRNVIV